MNKILITPRSLTTAGDPCLDLLLKAGYELIFSAPGRLPVENELIELVPGCVGYLAGVENITSKVLEVARDLKVISRNGTGIDNIDLETARRLNIPIMRAEGANARGVAELTIGLILSGMRSIPFCSAQLKSGKWTRRIGVELADRYLGIIGCGQIGKLVSRFALGMGMKVLAHDIMPDVSFLPSPHFKFVPLDDVFARCDVVSFHCNASRDGKPVFDRNTLPKLKPGVFLINTARASLVDENVVLDGLSSGQISAYATDVFQKEPPDVNPLLSHDRVITTPHLGGYTRESVARASRAAVENLMTGLKDGAA
jgi:D-3-phosphoglycerate dehydrogenase